MKSSPASVACDFDASVIGCDSQSVQKSPKISANKLITVPKMASLEETKPNLNSIHQLVKKGFSIFNVGIKKTPVNSTGEES